MPHPDVLVEKIGVTDLFKLKTSAKRYYIIIPRKLIEQYWLVSGHYLKIKIIEARKPFQEEAGEATE